MLTDKDIENINNDTKESLTFQLMEEALIHCYFMLNKIYYGGAYHISAIELFSDCDGEILEKDINELLLFLAKALGKKEDVEDLKEDKYRILKKLD